MSFIINPGSSINEENPIGWTNTHEQARRYAFEWFYKPMVKEGFADIKVIDTKQETEGRWTFIFKHEITGKEVALDIHGIDNLDVYEKQNIFSPRVYWNGGSSCDPTLEDFNEEGFMPVMTYKKIEDEVHNHSN